MSAYLLIIVFTMVGNPTANAMKAKGKRGTAGNAVACAGQHQARPHPPRPAATSSVPPRIQSAVASRNAKPRQGKAVSRKAAPHKSQALRNSEKELARAARNQAKRQRHQERRRRQQEKKRQTEGEPDVLLGGGQHDGLARIVGQPKALMRSPPASVANSPAVGAASSSSMPSGAPRGLLGQVRRRDSVGESGSGGDDDDDDVPLAQLAARGR